VTGGAVVAKESQGAIGVADHQVDIAIAIEIATGETAARLDTATEVAATGSIALEPIVLFLIIFIWTPPHFWALAICRAKEYERAGVPMLPVTHGDDHTRNQILAYSLLLAPLGCAPALIGLGGMLYLVSSAVLGVLFVVFAINCWRTREGQEGYRAAKQLFAYSVLYLFLLFAILLVEKGFGVGGGALPALWTI